MHFLQFFAKNCSFSSNCSTHGSRFGMKCSLEEPRTSVQVMCMRNDRLTDQKLGIVTVVHQFYLYGPVLRTNIFLKQNIRTKFFTLNNQMLV